MMYYFYCKMKLVTLLLALLIFCMNSSYIVAKELRCGFPGTPAYGFVKPDEAAFFEGDVVVYSCRVGYILLGSPISRCREDGSWSEEVPICDDSMTTLVTASSTPTVPGYPAEFAIDRDKEKCTYLQPKKPRWWRIDLGENKAYKVLSVAITMMPQEKPVKFTVYVIEIKNTIASYKRCASFSGKFGTPTVVLSCAEGKGIYGHKVHIEDNDQPIEGLFEICEVEIQVEKDTGYDCGEPSRSLYSEAKKISSNLVKYDCLRGYELKGQEYRSCEKTGQWRGELPICEPILCDELEPFENGVLQLRHGNDGPPLEGAIVAYKCNEGYKLSGSFIRNCTRDGTWSEKPPKCKVIRCPIPDGKEVGGVYRLINKTNSMGSLALLRCKGGKIEGDNPYIQCTEDGIWTEPEAECLIPARVSSEKHNKAIIVNQGVIIFGMVVAAVMIVIVLVGIYLYDQRRRNNKPEVPSRLLEPPEPPPRPPPRAKENAFRTAFKGFLNRELPECENQNKNAWKTQSLPSNHAQINDLEDSPKAKKTLSHGDSLLGNENSPDVVEVEVLAPHHFGYKGSYPPVPEEPENVAVEDVVIDMNEAESTKDSSAKDSGPKDYASVDYEKKRQSRLLKEQDSMESSSTAAGSPIPQDESETKESPSPTPPQKMSESEEEEEDEEESEESDSQKKKDEEERKAKEEEERKVKEEEERKAKEEEERKAKEEEERKKKEEEEQKAKEEEEKKAKEESGKKTAAEPAGRRRRFQDEPKAHVEEKPVLRRLRKF